MMEAIRFNTVVDDERVIRVPNGVALPAGNVEVQVTPVLPPPGEAGESLDETRRWLLDLADEIEKADLALPKDMAERHDHYAHGKPLP